MARINFEETWLMDYRREKLGELLGNQRFVGSVVYDLWRCSQGFWQKGELIPGHSFKHSFGAEALLKCDLVRLYSIPKIWMYPERSERHPNVPQRPRNEIERESNECRTNKGSVRSLDDLDPFFVYACGSREHHFWLIKGLLQRVEAGKRSAAARRLRKGTAQPVRSPERNTIPFEGVTNAPPVQSQKPPERNTIPFEKSSNDPERRSNDAEPSSSLSSSSSSSTIKNSLFPDPDLPTEKENVDKSEVRVDKTETGGGKSRENLDFWEHWEKVRTSLLKKWPNDSERLDRSFEQVVREGHHNERIVDYAPGWFRTAWSTVRADYAHFDKPKGSNEGKKGQDVPNLTLVEHYDCEFSPEQIARAKNWSQQFRGKGILTPLNIPAEA